ncbi:ribosomal protein L23-domain-containing protein [Pilobolus umbonatus]|nr:ribosomal protein L23-domain-containing protein [Pilobolus umbonatus]
MVRSPNLQPNQVAFRVPPSCNKFDIHSYLTNIYGVNIQEVRTMNYATTYKKGRNRKMEPTQSAYKKAIVTLDEPFHYPKESEWCKSELELGKLQSKVAGRKLNGWRVRAPEEDRVRMKEINDERMAQAEKAQKK